MTEQEEDKMLIELQDIWKGLADSLGWQHIEGVHYLKSNGVNETNYSHALQELQDFTEKYARRNSTRRSNP